MESYLYHRVPSNLTGEVLYPLNTLKSIHPDVYEKQSQKYLGREHLMQRTIPILNCLWNDVLHLSPVDPTVWKHALVEAGMPEKKIEVYKINANLLDPNQTIIYNYNSLTRINDPDDTDYRPFAVDLLPGLNRVPQATKQYYQDTYQTNQKPLVFHGIPHILYKGAIDISATPTIII